jgi:transposase
MRPVDLVPTMAPCLVQLQRVQLHDMIQFASLPDKDIAQIDNCSTRTVTRVRANMRHFGSPYAPKNFGSRRSCILPYVLDALLERLITKPNLYLDEMAEFILDEFELSISVDSIRRSLRACNWLKKKN